MATYEIKFESANDSGSKLVRAGSEALALAAFDAAYEERANLAGCPVELPTRWVAGVLAESK
jgi:hypothetical protein